MFLFPLCVWLLILSLLLLIPLLGIMALKVIMCE